MSYSLVFFILFLIIIELQLLKNFLNKTENIKLALHNKAPKIKHWYLSFTVSELQYNRADTFYFSGKIIFDFTIMLHILNFLSI